MALGGLVPQFCEMILEQMPWLGICVSLGWHTSCLVSEPLFGSATRRQSREERFESSVFFFFCFVCVCVRATKTRSICQLKLCIVTQNHNLGGKYILF